MLQVFWARNNYVALVMADLEVASDRKRLTEGDELPPISMQPDQLKSWSNRDCIRASKKRRNENFGYAQYSNTGEFEYQIVSLLPLQIYFASRRKHDDEIPIAVEILLGRKFKD